ncbi:DEAD-domain-containing protein [Punctularia strigosozonata HHB-11173 SS5]|uniref:DEAD-domain-containing protein n=1 Tax=Punctularia strigosozonata (strain HHB-11173) TaxID=741275 RepID=UPI0004418265|nr:DEAD-domain-containing protein [Punctularia strigosozonata HHB-11173 SS5]EIN07060.1 DEAD-domain-containing protein [Punctularia strigosozonata HHB-11173 SS5]
MDAVNKNLGYTVMSPVQAATLEPILQGKDCLAQAKTGTGKTLAFLIPAIQTLLASPPSQPRSIRAVVISPTRELARQISKEAEVLTKGIPEIRIHTSTGGTNVNTDSRVILTRPDLLVATPGRLKDHLSDPQRLACFGKLDFLVLDEADNLVDQGFYPEIRAIMQTLPPSQRQTLLFSATIPPEVKTIASTILSPGYVHISTISPDDVSTHERVPQTVITAPLNELPALALTLLRQELKKANGQVKAIFFYPTARQAQLAAELYSKLSPPLPLPVLEIHSRLSQSKRDNVAKTFREVKSALLCSSDVTARGMDFPDVTHVFQIGMPSSQEQYIHRVGRTGRAGKAGQGFLLLAPFETVFLKEIASIPITPGRTAPASTDLDATWKAMSKVNRLTKERTYEAWLGLYKGSLRKLNWKPTQLVQTANDMATSGFLLPEPPLMWTTLARKMNLSDVPGLRLSKQKPLRDSN